MLKNSETNRNPTKEIFICCSLNNLIISLLHNAEKMEKKIFFYLITVLLTSFLIFLIYISLIYL